MTTDVRRLKCFFESVTGGTWGAEPGGGEVDALCIRGTDFDFPRLRVDTSTAPLRAFSLHDMQYKAAARGDLIIEKSGGGESQPVGRAVLWDGDEAVVPTNFAARLRVNSSTDPRFAAYLLASLWLDGRTRAAIKQTTGIQNLDLSAFLDQKVLCQSLSTQRVIADFLDRETARIDALIAAKRRMVELVKERFRTHFVLDVLGEGAGDSGKRSRSGIYGTVPEGWAETALRHLDCAVQTGPFGSQLHADEYVADGWPVINPMNLLGGKITPNAAMTISRKKRAALSQHVLREGDIVFGRRGEMGRVGLVGPGEDGWLCGTGSLRLRLKGKSIIPGFLKLLLETPPARAYFELSSVGSTMENLNSEIVLEFPALIPPIDQQHAVVAAVSEEERKVELVRRALVYQIELLRERRQTLIASAVTGQLHIPEAA